MSETKPQKRIVSKGRYVVVMGKKVGLFSLIGTTAVLSLLFLLGMLLTLQRTSDRPTDWSLFFWMLAFSGISFLVSRASFRISKNIEPVEPISDQNARLLPLQDTLVRSSELPTVPQAELLRAIEPGQETPPEELLRAGDAEAP